MSADDLSAFKDYEREFTALITAVHTSVTSAGAASDDLDAASGALDGAGRDASDAGDVLQSMGLEASGLGEVGRAAVVPRLETARASAAAARAAVRDARVALAARRGEAARGALLGGGARGAGAEGNGARGGLRALEEGSASILESRRNVAATEGVAAGILDDLASQRATILRARGNLAGVDDGLEQSNAVLASMNRRAFMNKMVIYIIYAVIATVVLWILYSKLFR